MKIKYLGTAAAEAIPGMFCECEFCENARRVGGKEIRKRSGIVIDGRLMVDFSPDVNAAFCEYGMRLSDIKNIIFTHSHEDHAYMADLKYRKEPSYCILPKGREILHLYGNREVEAALLKAAPNPSAFCLDFTFLKPFEAREIDGYTITPLSVFHNPPEDAYVYLIEKEKKAFLYGNDTAMLEETVFDFLKDKRLDAVSLDCTMGFSSCRSHMGFAENTAVRKRLLQSGAANNQTVFVSHHFSHNGLRTPNGLWTYDDFEKMSRPQGFIMSYDGMELNL